MAGCDEKDAAGPVSVHNYDRDARATAAKAASALGSGADEDKDSRGVKVEPDVFVVDPRAEPAMIIKF